MSTNYPILPLSTLRSNSHVSKDDEVDVCCFLKFSFPDQVNEFRIFNEFKNLSAFGNVKETLLSLAPKVKRSFGVWDYRLSLQDLTELIEAFWNITHLDLYRNKFSNFDEEMQLSKTKKFNIKGLDFRWCSSLDIKKMGVIVRGLSWNQSLVNSLQYVWVTGTKLDINELQLLFTTHCFNVSIW